MALNLQRLAVANQVINLISPQTQLIAKNHRIWVQWQSSQGTICKQWQTRKGSFFPTWSPRFPEGGTYTTAIAQLINWVRDKPCLPLDTWKYWCSDVVGMKPKEILDILAASDYPKERKCYFCGRTDANLDWYTFGDKSGLGCYGRCETLIDLMAKEELKNKTSRKLK